MRRLSLRVPVPPPDDVPKSAHSPKRASDAVRYLDTPEAAEAFVRDLRDVRLLALDTEGASFHRFIDRIYLLQMTARAEDGTETSAILDPLAVGPLPALGELLADPAVEVVFHDADYDLRLLHQDYGWHPRPLFDTRIAAQLLGLRAFGLAALLEREFDVKLDKKHQRADWSMRPLTPDMLDYAAQDTRFLPELRELVQWRDGVAGQLDRSTFRVAGNEVLLEIARRAPRTREELAAIKGVPRGSLESRGAEMLEAVARGVAVPDAELPRFPRAPRWDRDPDFDARVSRLRGLRDDAAQRLDLDPGVLLSRERLEAVARRNPRTPEELAAMPELRRWQVAELGESLLAALREVERSAGAAGAAAAPPAPPTAKRAPRGASASSPAANTAAASTAAADAPAADAPAGATADDAEDDRSPYRDG